MIPYVLDQNLKNDDNFIGDYCMKFRYLGTSAGEGIPAVFCECETCKKAVELAVVSCNKGFV